MKKIIDAEVKTEEFATPKTVKGYAAFTKYSSQSGWTNAYIFNHNHVDMVLPSGWYRTRDEAINAANTPSYKGTTIKIVCVDFEVAE